MTVRCGFQVPTLRLRNATWPSRYSATPAYSATSGVPVSGSERWWWPVSATYSTTFFSPSAM